MDIRLKSKYLYKLAFVLAMYLISLSVMSAGNIMRNSGFLTSRYYFQSEDFKGELNAYFKYVKTLYTDYWNYDRKSDNDKATKEAIAELQDKNEMEVKRLEDIIKENFEYNIRESEAAGNKELMEKQIQERDQKIENVRKEYYKTIDEIKEEIVYIKDTSYNILKKNIASRNDIKYYIKDRDGGVYSNLDNPQDIEGYLKYHALYSIEFPQQYKESIKYNLINDFFRQTACSGYVIIPKDLNNTGSIYTNYQHFKELQSQLLTQAIIAMLSILAALLILFYLERANRKTSMFLNRLAALYKKLPPDLSGAILLAGALPFSLTGLFVPHFFFSDTFDMRHFIALTFIALYMTYLYLTLRYILKFIKEKNSLKNLWPGCLSYKLMQLIRDSFAFKGLVFKAVFLLLPTVIYGGCLGIGFSASIEGYDYGEAFLFFIAVATIIYFFTTPVYLLAKMRRFNNIVTGTEAIVSGSFNAVLESKGKGSLATLAGNINNMREGVKKSLEDQVKSERLKSELITNVSHDLKTPLTSIINYVDLLKVKDISKEEHDSYISILEKKTQRMRLLIEDLFEASKLSSGTVELNTEKIDVAALLYQALGEFDEKIKDTSLTFKVNAVKQNIYAHLDGRKTWRVFENLIGNILKYSHDNTRVYVDLEEVQNKAVLTMKNISAYELDFEPDELFERFKRGDKSRNTEGSGLGLAIAKSIVELQGGNLTIEIDGDLFKVTVEFVKAETAS